MHRLSIGCLLFFFWLALSGHYTLFLIIAGLVCAALTVFLCSRLYALDGEAHPIAHLLILVSYCPWLVAEMLKSAFAISRIILSPSLPISPAVIAVPLTQFCNFRTNLYANSITLTPGTIAVLVDSNRIVVHALTSEGASDLAAGGMAQRILGVREVLLCS